jgi:hypothetical protein
MDLYGAINSEESYESSGIGDGVSKIKFSLMIRGGGWNWSIAVIV